MPKDAMAELAIPTSQRDATAHPQFEPENQVVMTSKMVSTVPMIQIPVNNNGSGSGGNGANEEDDDDEETTPRADMGFQLNPTGNNNNNDDDDDDVTPRADAGDLKASADATASQKSSQMNAFELLGVLGVGAFAECHLAQRKDDGKLFALKKFKKVMDVLTPSERQEAIGEVRLLANLVHDNILRYEDSFLEGGAMHILMEYASGGTLDRLIDSYKARGEILPEEMVWDCMVQLCGALKYCHSRSIMHRDIKPQNVMLSTADEKTCRLLLGDFGIAKIMAHSGAQTKELAGTPYYYSPELCKGLAYDNKSDMWAIGVVLFELMAQQRPFESNNTFRVLYLISKNERLPTPTTHSKHLQDMCDELLEVDPHDRPSAAELMNRDVMKVQSERWRKHVTELEEAEVASDSKMASTAQGTASTYHKVMERLRYLCRWASNLGAEDFNEWYDSMERISARIHKTPELQHVDIYNQLGMANAEAGSFDEAIKTFRESLTIDKNDHLAMEQLGNLLVRTAFQMFKDREEAERKPPGSGKVSTIKEAETKTGEVSEPPTASRQRSRSNSKENKRPMSRGSFTNAIQKRLDEGIAFLEKVVEMEVSDERLALLGSAYKRLFMLQNGFFPKARDYLKKAAGYYHKADIEQKRRKGDGCYAILNALSLDMLLGESKSADLLKEAAPLSSAALEQQAHAPADVWLWVQVADILCIRYTLNDPEVLLDGVTAQYRKALVLGSSDRVKRSIEDQLHFMARTLQMRQQQQALDGKENTEEFKKLSLQLKRLSEVLQFVREQSSVSRSITKSMTKRRIEQPKPRRGSEALAAAPPPHVSQNSQQKEEQTPTPTHRKSRSHDLDNINKDGDGHTKSLATSSSERSSPTPSPPKEKVKSNNDGNADGEKKPKSDVCVIM